MQSKRKRRSINEHKIVPQRCAAHVSRPGALRLGGILAGTSQPEPLFLPDPGEESHDGHTGPTLLVGRPPEDYMSYRPHKLNAGSVANAVSPLEVEVVNFPYRSRRVLLNKQGARRLSAVLKEANVPNERGMAAAFQDKLTGLDEDLTLVTNSCYVSPHARAPRYRASFACI